MINNEADKLANEILNLSRNKLLVNLRFMDVALSYHKRLPYEGTLATDGHTLLYDPGFILRTYKDSQEEMVRMLDIVFNARPFLRRLSNAKANWLQILPEEAIIGVRRLIQRL